MRRLRSGERQGRAGEMTVWCSEQRLIYSTDGLGLGPEGELAEWVGQGFTNNEITPKF